MFHSNEIGQKEI